MKPYEFRSDIAISDSAFYAYGKDMAELFVNACLAVTDAMVEIDKVGEEVEKKISIESPSCETLLYDTLEEVVYLKDAEQLVFHSFSVESISTEAPDCRVSIIAKGEKIDREKHQAHADVKAITFLDYQIEKMDDGLRASVILDV